MPNCTCYAWGRFWEIGDPLSNGDHKPTGLPTSDGGSWFGDVIASGNYQVGQTPQLGAVACFEDTSGGSGHVAIVEEIDTVNGTITTSNSAWQSTYFYTQVLNASNNYNWSHYRFQGFIYNPYGGDTPTPPPVKKKHHFNFILFDKRRRDRKYYE